jgi:N utilization substance protein B
MSGAPVSSDLNQFIPLCEHFQFSNKAIPYAGELLAGICAHWEEINSLIQEHAANWRIDRMSVLDRNIIRIAVFEMCKKEDIPPGVAINEAIEIAKHYCSDDAAPFINGVLDAVRKARFGS